MGLKPRIRVPWQAIAAFAAALYAMRSVLRGWDFSPSAEDVLVFGTLAAILVVRAFVARHARGGNEED